MFLLVLLGILWALFSRRRSHEDKFVDADDDDDSSNHVRPTSLLAHINAATRNTILGGQSPYGHYGGEKEAAAGALAGSTAHGHDRETDGEDGAAGYGRTDTPTDGAYGSSGDEQFRVARARYSFDGGEEGELPLSAGTEVYVLDDRDPAYVFILPFSIVQQLTKYLQLVVRAGSAHRKRRCGSGKLLGVDTFGPLVLYSL